MAEMSNKAFQELFRSWSKWLPDVIDYQQLISLEPTTTLISENNNPHESTLEISFFEEEEGKIHLRLHQLEQRLVAFISTSFKLISYSLHKFKMRTNQRINELEEAQKRQKHYSRMLEK